MAPKRLRGESNAALVKISRQKKKRSSSSSSEKKKGEAEPSTSPPSTSPTSSNDASESSDSSVAELEAAILELLRSRKPGTNCCPSEIPRRLLGEKGDWRRLMPDVREAAARLVERDRLEITQRGVAVPDPRNFGGPIRLRLVREEG